MRTELAILGLLTTIVLIGIVALIIAWPKPVADVHVEPGVARVDTVLIVDARHDTLVIERPDIEARLAAIEARLPKCHNFVINNGSWTCIEPR